MAKLVALKALCASSSTSTSSHVRALRCSVTELVTGKTTVGGHSHSTAKVSHASIAVHRFVPRLVAFEAYHHLCGRAFRRPMSQAATVEAAISVHATCTYGRHRHAWRTCAFCCTVPNAVALKARIVGRGTSRAI